MHYLPTDTFLHEKNVVINTSQLQQFYINCLMMLNILLNINVSHKLLYDNELNIKLKIKFLFVE